MYFSAVFHLNFTGLNLYCEYLKAAAMKTACSCSAGDAVLIQAGLCVKQNDTVLSQQGMRAPSPAQHRQGVFVLAAVL